MRRGQVFLFIHVLAPAYCGDVHKTEAESHNFDISRLRPLGGKALTALQQLLRSPDFDFLGHWVRNQSFLLDMNAKLVRGDFVLIDQFLATSIAKSLYKEMRILSVSNRLEQSPDKVPLATFNSSGVDVVRYESSGHSARLRCELLGKAKFQFRNHDCCKGQIHSEAGWPKFKKEFPVMSKLAEDLSWNNKWLEAMNLLLTGSGMRILKKAKGRGFMEFPPYQFREFRDGDFYLLHEDALGDRVLSVNYYFTTPGWEPMWGGNLLWCGPPPFSEAAIVPPEFNKAVIFIPHDSTKHAVEPIKGADPSYHRFALTGFMTVKGMDAKRHWNTLSRHQQQQRMRMAPNAEL